MGEKTKKIAGMLLRQVAVRKSKPRIDFEADQHDQSGGQPGIDHLLSPQPGLN